MAEEFILQSINLSIINFFGSSLLQFNARAIYGQDRFPAWLLLEVGRGTFLYMDNTWQWLEWPRHKGVIRKFLNKLLTKKNCIFKNISTNCWQKLHFKIFNKLLQKSLHFQIIYQQIVDKNCTFKNSYFFEKKCIFNKNHK